MDEKVIKQMPKMLFGAELMEALQILPEYDDSIRTVSSMERLMALQDIYQVFIPGQMSAEIYSKLYLSLFRSLQKKGTILASRQLNQNADSIRKRSQSFESIIGGADSSTIIGPSGIGKSSSVSRCVQLLTGEPVITTTYSKIIACLQVQAPADCSIKGLLLEILRRTDEVLKSSYHEKAIRAHFTVDMLIGSVSQVALNHIGLLIVDEIQNVVNSKNGKAIIGTLTQLINNSGVSICMVGTPESNVFFDQQMMLARRSLGLQYETMEYDETFWEFCSILFQYQYVQTKTEMDETMAMWLYNHSAGNASVVVSLLHDAQELAILNGYEKLDITSLTEAYEKRLTMLHDFIQPVKMGESKTKKKKKQMELPAVIHNEADNDDHDATIIFHLTREKDDPVRRLIEAGIFIQEVAI